MNNQPTTLQPQLLPMVALEANKGQVEGLPKNPRLIKDEKFKKLKKSIEDNPEMLALRELLVYPIEGGKFVIIGGNMRYAAMRELGYTEAPCKVIPADTSVDNLRAYTIKDNSGFGEWDMDMLANEWDMEELDMWGVDVPDAGGEDNPYTQKTDVPVYEIKGEEPTIEDCIRLDDVEARIQEIDAADITDEQKAMLRSCAYRFAEIDFANMAEYYAHQDKTMQGLMESLALVIIDFDKAIEQGLVIMDKRMKDLYNEEA